MLQRVSAALHKYISPIRSSKQAADSRVEEEPKNFQRYKPPSKDSSDESKKDEGHPSPEGQEATASEGSNAPRGKLRLVTPPEGAAAAPATPGLSVSHAFLNLLRTLHQGQGLFRQWLGLGSYRHSQKTQRRNGTVRKGAMLDEKAE